MRKDGGTRDAEIVYSLDLQPVWMALLELHRSLLNTLCSCDISYSNG